MKLHIYRLPSKSKLMKLFWNHLPNKSILVPSSGKRDSKTLLEKLSAHKGNKRGNLKAATQRATTQQGFSWQPEVNFYWTLSSLLTENNKTNCWTELACEKSKHLIVYSIKIKLQWKSMHVYIHALPEPWKIDRSLFTKLLMHQFHTDSKASKRYYLLHLLEHPSQPFASHKKVQ